MKKIVIIGGGFAGLSAAAYLRKYKKQAEVILVDRKIKFNFLPLLPDVLSRRINDKFLSAGLDVLAKRFLYNFICSDVREAVLSKNKVVLDKEDIYYDYLIIASGSQTNFYGNIPLSESAFKIDDIRDAKNILNLADRGEFNTFIISGGGYTGVEIATNFWRHCLNKGSKKRIVIIEKELKLLAALPDWMRKYVLRNLADLGIEVYLNTQIESCSGGKVILKSGECFDKAVLIWAAGVKAQDFIKSTGVACERQGRVIVDEYLRLNKNCFCCGDTAAFKFKDNFLRMSVQFSIEQGRLAAGNIMRAINKQKLKKYCPLDLGYIIPMANNKACGNVLGVKVKGKLAVLLHYFMCVFRMYLMRNKAGIIKNLFKV